MNKFDGPITDKHAGELIRSDDWNKLAGDFYSFKNIVQSSIQGIESDISEINKTIEDKTKVLSDDIIFLKADIAAIKTVFDDFWKMTLETISPNYTYGQQAQIIARIYSLDGKPLTFSNSNRPWIEFISSWGSLNAASGYDYSGSNSTGNRALCVRTDSFGVAKVLLKAENSATSSLETDIDLDTFFQNQMPGSTRTMAQIILEAPTPSHAQIEGAFKVMTQEYEKSTRNSFQSLVDSYARLKGADVLGNANLSGGRWRDDQASVVAFAKKDNNSVSADQSRAVSSIQVTFRNCIDPWIIEEFISNIGDLSLSFGSKARAKIGSDAKDSAFSLKNEIEEFVKDRSYLERQRRYCAIRDALDELTITNPPLFLEKLCESLKNVISIQQSFELSGNGSASVSNTLGNITDFSLKADLESDFIQGEISDLHKRVSLAEGKIGSFQNTVGTLDNKIDALHILQKKVDIVEERVAVFEGLKVMDVSAKLNEISEMKQNIQLLIEKM